MPNTAKRFYNLVINDDVADLDIYGDIVCESWAWSDSDVSAWRLSRRLEELEGVSQINVNINSYGGEVAEGIAIYNALKRHSAKIVTRCDGMACSIASVIFMAGDERIMYAPSMLMIHNASSYVGWGNAAELRKAADDTEMITSMSKAAYMACVSITEEELADLMDAETWITPEEALDMGFATAIELSGGTDAPAQDARQAAFALLGLGVAARMVADPDPDDDQDPDDDPDDDTEDQDDGAEGEDPDPEDPDDVADPEEDPEDIDPDDDEDDKKDEQAFRSFVMAAL
jgi:ATP-dependent protease ClpP protease subunit